MNQNFGDTAKNGDEKKIQMQNIRKQVRISNNNDSESSLILPQVANATFKIRIIDISDKLFRCQVLVKILKKIEASSVCVNHQL
jgi:hypothetical protein